MTKKDLSMLYLRLGEEVNRLRGKCGVSYMRQLDRIGDIQSEIKNRLDAGEVYCQICKAKEPPCSCSGADVDC